MCQVHGRKEGGNWGNILRNVCSLLILGYGGGEMDMGGLLECYIRYPLVPHVRITNTCTYMYSHTWACYYVTPYMRKLPGYFAIPRNSLSVLCIRNHVITCPFMAICYPI